VDTGTVTADAVGWEGWTMALTDEEEKALKATHKVEIENLKAANSTDIEAHKNKADALAGENKQLKDATTGGDSYWQKEAQKAFKDRDTERAARKEAEATLETQPETIKAEAEAEYQLKLKEAEVSHSIKTLLNRAAVDPKMEDYALQALGDYGLAADESGALKGKIEDKDATAEEVVEHLRTSTPNFFQSTEHRRSLQMSVPGPGGKTGIKDKDGNTSLKLIDKRASNAFESEM